MCGSYNETIVRLEGILRELECEFLYLINDIYVGDKPDATLPLPVGQLELARHCLATAAKALRSDDKPRRDAPQLAIVGA